MTGDEDEAARRSLLEAIARFLGDDTPPPSDRPRSKGPPGPKSPAPKPPPALRSAPLTIRPVDEQLAGHPLIEEGGGPTRYVPPADGLLGGTERRRRK
jgi:hypothetical protein